MTKSCTVTVSSKYQVVIPAEIRESQGIKPGDLVHFFASEGKVFLVRIPPIERCRGLLKGIDTEFEREEDDRY